MKDGRSLARVDGQSRQELPWRQLSPPERLQSISKIFLFPAPVAAVLLELEHHFHSRRVDGPANFLLLTGPPAIGKRTVVRHFARTHPPFAHTDIEQQPVIVATPTSRSDAASVAEAILVDSGWPRAVRGVGAKFPEAQIDVLLRRCGTRMLILNRASFLAEGRNALPHHAVVFLTSLLDRGAATVLLVGEEGLVTLIENCGSLRDRVDARLRLAPLAFGREWTTFLRGFAKRLPFEDTSMLEDDMPWRLHVAARGKIPSLAKLTESAARTALYRDKSSRLLRTHFSEAFRQRGERRLDPFGNADPAVLAEEMHDAAMERADAVRVQNRKDA